MPAVEGTKNNPLPANTAAVEPKVKWMAIVTYLVSLVLIGIGELLQDGTFINLLPPDLSWIGALLIPFVPALLSLIAGFAARHQWRTPETTAPGVPGGPN